MMGLDEHMHVAEASYYTPGEDSCTFEPKTSDWGWFEGRLVALDYSIPAWEDDEPYFRLKDRDAVRPLEARSEAWSASIARGQTDANDPTQTCLLGALSYHSTSWCGQSRHAAQLTKKGRQLRRPPICFC